MKNLKNFLSLFVATIFAFGLFAQSEIAMVTAPIESNHIISSAEKSVVIDQTGIVELSQYIVDHINLPYESMEYANESKVLVQISLNNEGTIIDRRIVKSSNEKLGKEILKTLDKAGKVAPILVNGRAATQTFQIPLKFKR